MKTVHIEHAILELQGDREAEGYQETMEDYLVGMAQFFMNAAEAPRGTYVCGENLTEGQYAKLDFMANGMEALAAQVGKMPGKAI